MAPAKAEAGTAARGPAQSKLDRGNARPDGELHQTGQVVDAGLEFELAAAACYLISVTEAVDTVIGRAGAATANSS